MTEAIIRQHKRRVDRWMPRQNRFASQVRVKAAAMWMLRCVPGYLLSFADVLGIPSGLQLAYGLALAALGKDVRPTITGGAAAILMQLASGLPPRWELLLPLAAMFIAPMIVHGCSTMVLVAATVVFMLPAAIAASLQPTAAEMIGGWAGLLIAALSAPVFARGMKCLQGDKHISAMEERIAVGYLAAVCLCGGARMLLGVNVGVLLSAGAVLSMALVLGVGAGSIAGMLAGLILAFQGLTLVLSVALAMGGFLAGVANSLSRRSLSCGAFAMGAWLPLLLCGANGFGCGAAVLAAAAGVALLPREGFERLQNFLRRFLTNRLAPGDAYAAAALTAWEHTVAALARAVPSPRDVAEERDGTWWHNRLCQGCPEYEKCGCLTTELGMSKAEQVWAYRAAHEKVWQDALENLRGMGCQRLYHLLEAMQALRQEEEAAQHTVQQAEAQRRMLVTHLMAISGAARRFAMLSSGESWWDDMAARRLRKVLSERATPAALTYVRRIQGHVQVAFELQFITGARTQAEDLCSLAAAVLNTAMEVADVDGDRVMLRESPLLRVEVSSAAESISGEEICGDTVWCGVLQDGRYMAALSDGMGHGDAAALCSRQSVELLRLCQEAGYSRQQTLTAVNGMMLLVGGERFATADLLTIDLWKGTATLDKLGAAASWLYQQGSLTRLTGDALPLGIIDGIELSGSSLQLTAGDVLILLSDGVEDAFTSPVALETALLDVLNRSVPCQAAQDLLDAAGQADSGQRRDDQSAVFVFIRQSGRV